MELLAVILVIAVGLGLGFWVLVTVLRRSSEHHAATAHDQAIEAAVRAALAERQATAEVLGRERSAAVEAAVARAAEVADQKLDARLRAGTEQLDARFRQGAEKLEANMALGHERYDASTSLIEKQNLELRREMKRMEKMLTDLQEKTSGQHGAVVSELRQAVKVTAQLQATTGSLQEALGSAKRRGNWGERIAEDVLAHAGLKEGLSYRKQTGIDSGGRPDFTILMPRDMVLHMDVKFPLDNYRAFLEASQQGGDADAHRRQFLRDARSRVKELADRRYHDAADSVDTVVLFVPNESVFGFLQENDDDLLDEAMRAKVVLCGPSTLIAVLQVIRQAMDNFMLEQRSNEIMACLADFKKEWQKFSDQVEKHGKHLNTAMNSFTELSGARTNQLGRQVQRIDALQAAPVGAGDTESSSAESGDRESAGSVGAERGGLDGVDGVDAEVIGEGDAWPPRRHATAAR